MSFSVVKCCYSSGVFQNIERTKVKNDEFSHLIIDDEESEEGKVRRRRHDYYYLEILLSVEEIY